MTDALPLRIFLASPGDLDSERATVRACIGEYNSRRGEGSGVTYEPVGWERVRGTARRPQDAINELIAESHFMVVLFKASWGSEPGSPWGYTSGTEEEFFTGLLELGEVEQPMRDIWIAFVDAPSADQKINDLKKQIINQHSLLFETIVDLRDLKTKLNSRLESWEELAGSKTPRHVDLVPSSGRDVLRAATLRLRGEKLIDLGQRDAGRASLEESAMLGGPIEQLAYGRFLRREGDLVAAYECTQKAIDYFVEGGPIHSADAAEAFSAQARVLAAQGHHDDAIGRLEHALTLVANNGSYSQSVRCRILDDLGLAYQKVNDLAGARGNFEKALLARRAVGHVSKVCQTLINLARLEMADGNPGAASNYADEVIATLRWTPPSGLHANAHALIAQVRLRQGRPNDGISNAKRALAVNRQIANRLGEAISLLVLGQCCREAGQLDEARMCFEDCLVLNQSMGNERGAANAKWQLENLPQ